MRILLILAAMSLTFTASVAQDMPSRNVQDTTLVLSPRVKEKKPKAADGEFPITDYLIIGYDRDTTHFDTTLTIQKEYRFNYLRRDAFELLPFSNTARGYNALALQSKNNSWFPEMGVRSKHMNYWATEDIDYYRVPTPTSELFWKTVMEQGQLLDAMVTMNTSERFNFSLAYRGTRSLGKYQHFLSSTGHFRFTFNYQSRNQRYFLRGHHVSQDLLNQENGGISVPEQFTSGEAEFIDRSRIDVRFQDAENELLGKRYFLDHYFWLVKPGDSLHRSGLKVGHELVFENKTYDFVQNAENAFFGDAFQRSSLFDRTKFKTFRNTLSLGWTNPVLGSLTAKGAVNNYNYYYNSAVITDAQRIDNRLKGTEYALGGLWEKSIGKFKLHADAMQTLVGDLGGTRAEAGISFPVKELFAFQGGIRLDSRMPDLNMLLYQSDYQDYNWQNSDNFSKETISEVYAKLDLKYLGSLEANYQLLSDYTYFANTAANEGSLLEDEQLVRPFQYGDDISYLKLTYAKEFRLGNFALDNRVMFQKVDQNDPVLNVPEWVTRNTLYYSNHLFKKALYLQTGLTFKYFTSYYANAYSPLLGEFYVQDREEIGDFPMFDFFINAKVKRTRIYLKAEHFNSSFTGYNFYTAPAYPYRDFIIRFGLVWNFFS